MEILAVLSFLLFVSGMICMGAGCNKKTRLFNGGTALFFAGLLGFLVSTA